MGRSYVKPVRLGRYSAQRDYHLDGERDSVVHNTGPLIARHVLDRKTRRALLAHREELEEQEYRTQIINTPSLREG